ncbi:MAG: hypothetical protein ACRD0B_05470 [Acidimicrobiales bacterium]
MTRSATRSQAAKTNSHTLMLPPREEALNFSPTWVRGRGTSYHDAEAVTLVMALEEEPAHHHLKMLTSHLEVLDGWVEIGEDALRRFAPEAPERVGIGFALLVFAAELSSALCSGALGQEISPELRAASTEAIAQATLTSAGCLASTVSDYLVSIA